MNCAIKQRILPKTGHIQNKDRGDCNHRRVDQYVCGKPFDAVALVYGHGCRLEQEIPTQ